MFGHTIQSFDDDLREIGDILDAMGALASTMVSGATAALLSADTALARRVISDDAVMDDHQRGLDALVIALIALRQPMAEDLRTVVGAMRIAGDLERIGDLAKNIAKRVAAIGANAVPRSLSHSIDAMAQLVLSQLNELARLYGSGDAPGLARLRAGDERVDVRYNAVFRELLTYMMEDPRKITPCTHLLFCAKNLERIGDHVTNIAENAYYMLTGEQLPPDRPKQDETAAPAA